jgi:Flp pilus assembly pilin Flp
MTPARTKLLTNRLSGGLASSSRAVCRDERGVTVVEFALVAPVFLLMLLGIFNLGHLAYAQSVLNGAVQNAARNSALETANTQQTDNAIRNALAPLLQGEEFSFTRRSYFDFVDIGRPERWNDANNNGICDNNEAYTDENRSGEWEADVATNGNGGAGDVVIYTVAVSYNAFVEVPFAPESWQRTTLSSTAVRKNQPFASQTRYASAAGTCS